MSYRLAFTDDPAEFLEAAGEHLAADPVLNTVIATVATRTAEQIAAGRPKPDHPEWWLSIHDVAAGDAVVGVAMRTAPFTPYPMYVLPMPDDAALALADALAAREEEVTASNGALPASRLVAEELAALSDGTATTTEHMRLFELGELVVPAQPPGRLRLATPDDAEICLEWFEAFEDAAAEQAGRPHRLNGGEHVTADFIADRIAAERIHLWETPAGDVVHLTAFNPPAFGVARVGPVYTPDAHRGNGYASAAVAEVSRQILESGARACLFTDQANPTSNRIYQAIGYEAVVDMANHSVSR
jgi:GNAT superfamily N-acetyltransferase